MDRARTGKRSGVGRGDVNPGLSARNKNAGADLRPTRTKQLLSRIRDGWRYRNRPVEFDGEFRACGQNSGVVLDEPMSAA